MTTTIKVDTAAGVEISPRLFGIFLEDLNHAIEGGLHAEMVKNRAFNAPEPIGSWEPFGTRPGAYWSMGAAQHPDKAKANRWQLRLQVVTTDGGRVGVLNRGYWGIAVREGGRYKLTLDAGQAGLTGLLHVTLGSESGQEYARIVITPAELGTETAHQRIERVLESNATDPQARLEIWVEGTGRFWLDYVSLIPVEALRPENCGCLRPDVLALLVALKPSFMRFPGGCFVEGDWQREAFRWKETLDEPAHRKGHLNGFWGYHCHDGLGMHEYLLLCERLHAEPLFVINAGISHLEEADDAATAQWIQDAVDAVEYANGPEDSTWGRRRAEAGHPAPFNLRFVEVGNENGGPRYNRNFPLFRQAIQARFPEIVVISNVPDSGSPQEMQDEHYFGTVRNMLEYAVAHDRRDRKLPKIYVGEYACCGNIKEFGLGTLHAALAEAAMMTGFERNGDTVAMASYAPLFTHTNERRWDLDAIILDNHRVFGTPSYWVQQMFSGNRVQRVLPVTITGAPPAAAAVDKPGIWASAGFAAGDRELVVKLVNLSGVGQAMCLDLGGLPLGGQAESVTLTHADPQVENTLPAPATIVPVKGRVAAGGSPLTHELPGWSLTVLRLPMRP